MMNNSPLDQDLLDKYNQSDIFKLLVIGVFIYLTGASVANVFSTFIKDLTIMLDAISVVSLVLNEVSYYVFFVSFVVFISNVILKKYLASDANFNRIMRMLVLSYFILQFLSFAYTYWGYEYLGDTYFNKSGDYYSDVKDFHFYQMYIGLFRFLPAIFCPIILLYFGKKLKN